MHVLPAHVYVPHECSALRGCTRASDQKVKKENKFLRYPKRMLMCTCAYKTQLNKMKMLI